MTVEEFDNKYKDFLEEGHYGLAINNQEKNIFKLLILLPLLILTSCINTNISFPGIVTRITFKETCCKYHIRGNDEVWSGNIIDSCGKFNIGDTVKTYK